MVRGFLSRCPLSLLGINLQAAHAISVFTLWVPAVTWSRTLTECKNSGLLRDDGAYSLEEFDKVLKELVILNPAHLDLKAADLQAAKSFDVPGASAVAAVPRFGATAT